ENPLGTAPGYRISCERELAIGARRQRLVRHLAGMPRGPREMKPMFDDHVAAWIRELRGAPEGSVSRTFQTFGMGGANVDEVVGGLVGPEEARVSYRASFPMISVRLRVKDQAERAEQRVEVLAERVRAGLGAVVFGEGDVTMEEMVGRALVRRGAKLAVAESCSGGLVGHRITEVAGCSAYFVADYVTYSDQAKMGVLGVSRATLERFGAVSEETAREMAEGARKRSGADVAVAISGIAGPEGGTADKPV